MELPHRIVDNIDGVSYFRQKPIVAGSAASDSTGTFEYGTCLSADVDGTNALSFFNSFIAQNVCL